MGEGGSGVGGLSVWFRVRGKGGGHLGRDTGAEDVWNPTPRRGVRGAYREEGWERYWYTCRGVLCGGSADRASGPTGAGG